MEAVIRLTRSIISGKGKIAARVRNGLIRSIRNRAARYMTAVLMMFRTPKPMSIRTLVRSLAKRERMSPVRSRSNQGRSRVRSFA